MCNEIKTDYNVINKLGFFYTIEHLVIIVLSVTRVAQDWNHLKNQYYKLSTYSGVVSNVLCTIN